MPGFRFVVTGDYPSASNTAGEVLQSQGYTLEPTGDFSFRAERGSKGGSIALGAFSGKSGRHVILDAVGTSDSDGNIALTLTEGTNGMSGGLIGMKQAKGVYKDAYDALGAAFQTSGTFVSGAAFK